MFSLTMLAALFLSAQAEMAPFDRVELSNGGEVVIVHGPAQSVAIRQGEAAIRVEGGRLLIANCPNRCPRGHQRLRVEIVTPALAGVAVADGGLVRSEGAFPRQAALEARVDSGGVIDLRSLTAGNARATVRHGGVILIGAAESLDAGIEQGGRITYWGAPRLRSSVRRGGVVERGEAEDLGRPLGALEPVAPLPVPPLPPVPNLLR